MIGIDFTTIPPFLTGLSRFVMWAEQERNGKKTKVPLTAAGRAAKSTDPATWCDFNTASGVMRLKLGNFHGIGIALGQLASPAGEVLGGIDLDLCLDADGNIAAWAQPIVALLLSLGAYIEVSPSGTGLKCLLRSLVADLDQLRTAFAIAPTKFGTKKSVPSASNGLEHGPAIEVYLGHGRYFAITGRRYTNAQPDVALLDLPALLKIAELVRQATGTAPSKKARTASGRKTTGRDTSRSAIAFRMGMALYREGKTFDQMCAEVRAHPDTAEWCAEKGDADNGRELQRIWDGAIQNAREREIFIRVVEGELDRLADEAETALIARSYDIFQRGVLVRPAISELPAADGGQTFAATLHEISTYGLLDAFCATAQWVRQDKGGAWTAVNPPFSVASILRDRIGNWRVSPCRGILMTPTLRPDGSVLADAGLDSTTSYFLWLPPDLKVPKVSDQPSKAESEAALQLLEGLLGEFPFVDKASKSVALSIMICAVIRAAMPVAPIHAASSPVAGTGKSYLFDIAAAIATGNRCPVIFAGAGKEELEKKLNGLLLAGVRLINLDNLDQPLAGDLLCQAAERPLLDLRRLGKSDPVRSLNGSLICTTGNNLATHGDLARRVLEALLDRGIERPELHKFTNDPVKLVLADRGKYIHAILTLVRGCLVATDAPEVAPLVSYEAYSKFVRAPLVWLGRADPIGALVGERHTDPIANELVSFMTAWEECIGLNTAMTAAEIARNADKGPPSPDPSATAASFKAWADDCAKWKEFGPIVNATCAARGHATSREIGDWLRRNKDRVVNERRFIGTANRGGLMQWRLTVAPRGAP